MQQILMSLLVRSHTSMVEIGARTLGEPKKC